MLCIPLMFAVPVDVRGFDFIQCLHFCLPCGSGVSLETPP